MFGMPPRELTSGCQMFQLLPPESFPSLISALSPQQPAGHSWSQKNEEQGEAGGHKPTAGGSKGEFGSLCPSQHAWESCRSFLGETSSSGWSPGFVQVMFSLWNEG